jgi:hypothetical protein
MVTGPEQVLVCIAGMDEIPLPPPLQPAGKIHNAPERAAWTGKSADNRFQSI